MVFGLASTGTVVSSPWMRSAASTCARIKTTSLRKRGCGMLPRMTILQVGDVQLARTAKLGRSLDDKGRRSLRICGT